MNYTEALKYLEERAVFGIKPGLERVSRLLELMGNPQNSYKTIHVTGTNGKGSVSAMLAAVFKVAGIRTGLFTSPHLITYRERMQMDGQLISQADFAAAMTEAARCESVMAAEGSEAPTQFEVLTAAAFWYFQQAGAEYAIIEVGLGGTLDSTNVIVPEISVITNVTFEHADKCGGTLEGIAHHKAGIIKAGVPVVTGAEGMPLSIIKARAHELESRLYVMNYDFAADVLRDDLAGQQLRLVAPVQLPGGMDYFLPLLGRHQVANSSLAAMAAVLLSTQETRLTANDIKQGLSQVEWPGRFERRTCRNVSMVLDGAHNPAGIATLRQSLDSYYPQEPRVFLLGILKDKDIDNMVKLLLRPEDTVVVTTPQSERAQDPVLLAANRNIPAKRVETCPDTREALKRALELAATDRSLLIVAGSLYLLGDIRRQILAGEGEAVE